MIFHHESQIGGLQMNNLTINKKVTLPVIDINFQQIEETLKKSLEEYKALVVTEDTLPACRDARKELNNLSKEIETVRKGVKKELTAPIKDFEDKCKDLLSLVEDAKAPIGDAINEFTEKKRLEKKEKVTKLFNELMESSGLEEKYSSRIEIKDSHFTINKSMKSIKEDIENQIAIQVSNQDKEANNKAFVENQLSILNQQLSAPIHVNELFISDYENMDISFITSRINTTFNTRKDAEEKARIEAERRIKQEAERKAKEEYERKLADEQRAKEEAERKEREEHERIMQKEAEEAIQENNKERVMEPPSIDFPDEEEIGFSPVEEIGFEPIEEKEELYFYTVVIKAPKGKEDEIQHILGHAGFEIKVTDVNKEV